MGTSKRKPSLLAVALESPQYFVHQNGRGFGRAVRPGVVTVFLRRSGELFNFADNELYL